MRTPRVLLQMVRADFLERARSYNFLILLCASLYLGYAVNMGQIVIRFNICKEIFDTPWVSAMVALAITFLLGFFGFFVVKGSIERDARTGVGQIMAATPLKRIEYVFGKWLSHFVILCALVIVLAIVTVLIQAFRLDPVNLSVLISPFLWLTVPFMALVAAVAVLFESLPIVKGSLSNLIYFFLFVFLLVTVTSPSQGRAATLTDPSGIRFLLHQIKAAGLYCGEKISIKELDKVPTVFESSAGITWSTDILLSRLGIFAAALSLTALSSTFFNRFDSSNEKLRAPRIRKIEKKISPNDGELPSQAEKHIHLTPLPEKRAYKRNLLNIILAEMLLMLKGNHWMWYIGAIVLWVFSILASQKTAALWITISAIWPLLIWSKMGIRESYYRTNQIVFSCSKPLFRLLSASWIAGVLVTAILWSGGAINFIVHGQSTSLLTWMIAVLSVPSFALMLGTWTGSNKFFEVFYLLIWYAGIANRLPALDFIGLTSKAFVFQHPIWMLVVLTACVFLAFMGRRQKLNV